MPKAPRLAAVTALAAVATLAFSAPISSASAASGIPQFGQDPDDSLVNVSDNNIGPFQACNNDVPVNVLGGQVPVDGLTGTAGVDNDENSAESLKNCGQKSDQDNGDDSGDGSLVNVSDNNIGPFQACNNDVPVNVLGGQGTGSDLTGTAGADNDGNSAESVKNCEQESSQANDGSDDGQDGDSDDGSLVNVSDNNVGPFQVCNNDVPVNVLGVQVPISAVAGVLGFDNDANTADLAKNCEQESSQSNDEGTPEEDAPVEEPPADGTPNEDTPDEGTPNEDTPDEGTPNADTPDEDAPKADTPDDADKNVNADPEESSVLPNTGGPAATLLALGLLGLGGGAFLVARNRRGQKTVA